MGKLFTTVSTLWVLFIPLASLSKAGIVDFIDDCHVNSKDNNHDIMMLIKQLGELRDSGLITKEEFQSKKQILLKKIL